MNTEGRQFASEHERKEALVDYMMNAEGADPCPYTRDQIRQFVDIGEHAAQQAMETIVRVCGIIDEPTIAVGVALHSMVVANDSFMKRAQAKAEGPCDCLGCQLERAGININDVIIVGEDHGQG